MIDDVFGEPIYSYSSNQAVDDGVLFDIDSFQRHWKNCPLKYVTANLMFKGYWVTECKNGVKEGKQGIDVKCKSCEVFKESCSKLACLNPSLDIANFRDLLHQSLQILGKMPKDDYFVSGKIELPSGAKQKIFIAQNETGRFTIMLPEDY